MSDGVRKTAATPSRASKAGDATANSGAADRIEITVNGVRIDVSPELVAAVRRAYQGRSHPLPKEMTTTQAAEFLDVSRPFIIKLTRHGELPCRLVGKHRRIPSEAILAYREQMFQRARQAADEMAQIAQDAGLYGQEPRRKAQ
jgi:excisionase family DNA binding protein